MKVILVLLFTSFSFGQSNIVASGHKSYTVGETFPIMQQVDTVIQVSLGVPKFEIPKPQPQPAVKKENWFIKLLKKIFGIK